MELTRKCSDSDRAYLSAGFNLLLVELQSAPDKLLPLFNTFIASYQRRKPKKAPTSIHEEVSEEQRYAIDRQKASYEMKCGFIGNMMRIVENSFDKKIPSFLSEE